MLSSNMMKYMACAVVVMYLSVVNASNIFAAEHQFSTNSQMFAQATNQKPAEEPATSEEVRALQQIYQEKIRTLEAEINRARGTRKNLLTMTIATFAAGGAINFAVNMVNDEVGNIPIRNPEEQSNVSDDIDTRIDECELYACTFDEKRDAQDALDGIQGIGGGIFAVGIVGILGYFLYSKIINNKQNQIDTLRSELGTGFEPKRGITPEYLQRNESVAAILDEIDSLKKEAGRARTTGEIFSRLAIGSVVSGLFLIGVSNASKDIVEDITVDSSDAEEVAAKNDALDRADSVETIGLVLLGAGVASGVTSFVFGRWAKGKEDRVNTLENSLLRVAERIHIYPKSDGVMIMYTYNF